MRPVADRLRIATIYTNSLQQLAVVQSGQIDYDSEVVGPNGRPSAIARLQGPSPELRALSRFLASGESYFTLQRTLAVLFVSVSRMSADGGSIGRPV